jgi:hypothetical protein
MGKIPVPNLEFLKQVRPPISAAWFVEFRRGLE